MKSKLHMNAVLTGCVDSFCLVCEYHLRGEDAAEEHVARAVHRKNLDSCPYLEKFAGDCIRRVKKGYFCEFCNLLLPTATKVSLHIVEAIHNENKAAYQIQRIGTHIVISEHLLISEQAWNGIIEETCAICNAEFYNLKLHVTDQKHVLSLIKKKVEFDVENVVYYRKIDDLSFHCLICNMIYALNIFVTHHNDNVHKTNVKKCQDEYNDHVKNNKENLNKESTNLDAQPKKKCKDTQASEINANIIKENKTTQNGAVVSQPKQVLKENNKQNLQNEDTKTPQDSKSEENAMKNESEMQKVKIPECCIKVTNTKDDLLIHAKTKNNEEDKIKGDNNTAKKGNSKNEQPQKIDKDQLFEYVPVFQKNGVNINFETETAFCKKCFEDIRLDLESIQIHIGEHKNKPTKEGPNLVHTVDLDNSKTVLNCKTIDKNQTDKSTIAQRHNLDQNHNETKATNEKEEIIKIDLTKKSDENYEETDSNVDIAPYIHGAAKLESAALETNRGPAEKVDTNDPAAYAQANKLTFNKSNKNAFCRICKIRVPSSIKNMKEHVTGSSHQRKAAIVAEAEKYIPKKPMGKYVTRRSTVMNIFGVDDVILNDKFCLTRMSYYMITVQNRLRCQACEVNLIGEEISRHVDSDLHERAMDNTPVVTNLDNEFVREVRPGLFHCGYCNLIVGIYEDVAKHLQCSDHRRNKSSAKARLDEHLPSILANRSQREQMQDMMIMQAMFERFGPFL